MNARDAKTESWHALDSERALEALKTAVEGLSAATAQARLTEHGANILSQSKGQSWALKLGEQFIQPLVVVLIGAAGLSIFLEDYVDAGVIGLVVVGNGLVGFFQEFQAEQSIAALSKTLVTEATVVRDRTPGRVPSQDLVPGDIVLLKSGDTVPADLRLLEVKDLRLEEASLTGESLPAEKAVVVLPEATVLGDRTNMAYAGSAVTYGVGRGVVTATGDRTETGRIASMLSSSSVLETPLTRRIAQLSRLLLWTILTLALVLVLVEWARGHSLVNTFNAAVALAVGMIPEGLPAAVTVVLAVGVSAMAKRGALIRRLPAVETLGSTTVICSDKTGTLTENQMTVTTIITVDDRVELTGVGFQADGQLVRNGKPFEPTANGPIVETLRAGALCNDSRLVQADGQIKVEGDPTEAALIVAAQKTAPEVLELDRFPRLDAVPFESAHMYMASLHRSPDGPVLYVKGSSDALLDRCTFSFREEGSAREFDRQRTLQEVDSMAAEGLRVLLMARRKLGTDATQVTHDHVSELEFLGLVGMIDPPRSEAKQAISGCIRAGIQVKMITGDHAVTAAAIAGQLGIPGQKDESGRLRTVTGQELAELREDEFANIALDVGVFARVAPEQKLMLVRALQSRGHVVAMTGDGVNDAPALKQADIGVAMGKNGTDVARSAAAMILTDDNFATIASAVEEGRGTYDNLVKFIAWTLPTNGGEGLVLLFAVILGTTLPVLPVQLLWINLTTALLGMVLILEPREPDLMDRPPRPKHVPLLTNALIGGALLASVVVAGAAFAFFAWAQQLDSTEAESRTVALNTIVVVEVGYLFGCRSLRLPTWKIGYFSNYWVWLGGFVMLLIQAFLTYVPFMNRLFHTAPIEAWWWLAMSGAGFGVFILAELKKALTQASLSKPS